VWRFWACYVAALALLAFLSMDACNQSKIECGGFGLVMLLGPGCDPVFCLTNPALNACDQSKIECGGFGLVMFLLSEPRHHHSGSSFQPHFSPPP
jgi:hypothetical protein